VPCLAMWDKCNEWRGPPYPGHGDAARAGGPGAAY
jgi:hypothetical protein